MRAPAKPLILALCLAGAAPAAAQTRVAYDPDLPQLRFAVDRLERALAASGESLTHASPAAALERVDVLVLAGPAAGRTPGAAEVPASLRQGLEPQGFRIARLTGPAPALLVIGGDATGAMYGVLDLAEQIRMTGGLEGVRERSVNPRLSLRAVKFNLPWSPYRDAAPNDLHLSVSRDLKFWERFLDMMAENRFNALTLWNLHPFPYLVRPTGFPEATPFDEREMSEWRTFWSSLFRMAKDRGIETYLVNWNIVVSPEFAAAHGVRELNDTSEIVRRYTREVVTQVINEYPDLTGLGVTLADWMNDMTPEQREDWIENTFVAGMKAADRPVKFIHRSVLAGSPLAMRRVIDAADLPDPVWVEVKFNWSHGHSTPRLAITHDYTTGEIDERFWNPLPENYRIAWMVRNEDFFILRWGAPEFIREHIAINHKAYVDGYFVGSEGYIPAVDYSHELDPHQTWQYAFEKQWLFYTLWGRLTYDPETPDAVFASAFDERYGDGVGEPLLRAHGLASRMPLRLAAFHVGTWDYTLYSEGFLAPAPPRGTHGISDRVSPFISILELIEHETLDPTYLSIPEFVGLRVSGRAVPPDRVTPLALADSSERDSRAALEALEQVRPEIGRFSGALECEVLDVEAWSHLGLYFAEKLRAGVALETFRRTGAETERQRSLEHLRLALGHWDRVIGATAEHYRPAPHVFMERFPPDGELRKGFTWEALRDQVVRDLELARDARPTAAP